MADPSISRMRTTRLDSVRQDRSLKDQIFASLRSAIIDGRLMVGNLYSVQSLANDLGVSRTPVREALIDLESRGMVRFERNQGVRILETSVHDLKEILTLRILLEVPATYRATEQVTPTVLKTLLRIVEEGEKLAVADYRQILDIDRGFHSTIMLASGNRRLSEYVDHLRDLIVIRGLYTEDAQRDLGQYIGQHREIYQAMERHDPRGAALAMKEHLVNTARQLLTREGDTDGGTDWADLLALSE
jgi:DNA-binding GntR family transcriptional regulator